MSRYRGPKVKIIRRFGQQLPGLTRKSEKLRTNPPGQHGQRRGRPTVYGERLREKQKLRLNYGISEKQMRRYMVKSKQRRGDAGKNLLSFLEGRLDNVVFRLGFAPTNPAARQLVSHNHILVNGRKVNIPSYQLKAGDQVTLKDKSKKMEYVLSSLSQPSLDMPSYLSYDEKEMVGEYKNWPEREDTPLDIQENLIVEFYSGVV